MNSIVKDLQKEFKKSSILNKLIYINIAVFIIFNIVNVISFMFQFNMSYLNITHNLSLPANLSVLIKQPWSFISYMFLHNGFIHLLFNMIWLHFGGKLFLQYLNPKQLLSTYILGGIFGGTLFIITYNYVPVFKPLSAEALAVGSSASVFAIMTAIATYTPNYSIQLPFVGNIKLKHITIFMITLDILSIPKANAGGHIAHLGGALFGFIYVKQLKKGRDYGIYHMISSVSNFIQQIINIFTLESPLKKSYKRTKSDYEFNSEKAEKQKEIDKILEKIGDSGYESLSKKEKAILFNESKK